MSERDEPQRHFTNWLENDAANTVAARAAAPAGETAQDQHIAAILGPTWGADYLARRAEAVPPAPVPVAGLRERIEALPFKGSTHPDDTARQQYLYGWDDAIADVLALLDSDGRPAPVPTGALCEKHGNDWQVGCPTCFVALLDSREIVLSTPVQAAGLRERPGLTAEGNELYYALVPPAPVPTERLLHPDDGYSYDGCEGWACRTIRLQTAAPAGETFHESRYREHDNEGNHIADHPATPWYADMEAHPVGTYAPARATDSAGETRDRVVLDSATGQTWVEEGAPPAPVPAAGLRARIVQTLVDEGLLRAGVIGDALNETGGFLLDDYNDHIGDVLAALFDSDK